MVRAIELDHPRLSLVKLKDGSANWDITKKDTTAAAPADTAGRAMAVSLRRFEIDSGVVAVDNQAGNLKASVVGFDQSLAGDFGADQLTIETRAHADEVSLEFAGIPYLKKVRLDLSTDVAADLAKKRFTLKQSGVRLNELTLAFSGSVASVGDRLALDVAFGAPKTEFKHILSLVPAVYTRDFASVQTSGSLAVSGKVKGEYAENAFPSLALNAKVENGTFRYPDLPLPPATSGWTSPSPTPAATPTARRSICAASTSWSARTRWTRSWWCGPRSRIPTWTRASRARSTWATSAAP